MTEFLYQKFDLFDRSPIESFNPGRVVPIAPSPQLADPFLLLAQLRPDEIVVDAAHLSREAHSLLRRAVPDGLFNALPPRVPVKSALLGKMSDVWDRSFTQDRNALFPVLAEKVT